MKIPDVLTISTSGQMARFWHQGKIIIAMVIVGKMISLIWKLLLAKSGPAALGQVEIAMTVFFSLQAFSLLGIHTALMRFTTIAYSTDAPNRGQQYLFLSLRISVLISILFVLFFVLFPNVLADLFHESGDMKLGIIKYLWVVPILTMSELIWTFLAAAHHTHRYAFGKYILPPLCRLLMLILIIAYGVTQEGLIVHVAAASLIVFIVSLGLSKGILHLVTQPLPPNEVNGFIRFTIPMSGSFLLYTIYGAMDVALVSRYLGVMNVGILSAAVMFAEIPDLIMASTLNIFQVHLGSFHSKPVEGFVFALKNIAVFLGIGLIIILTVYIVAPIALPFLLGPQFMAVTQLIGGLIIVKVFESSVVLPLRHTLDFYGHTNTTLVLMAIATLTKLVTGIITIPNMGLSGIVVTQAAGVTVHLITTLTSSYFYALTDSRQSRR